MKTKLLNLLKDLYAMLSILLFVIIGSGMLILMIPIALAVAILCGETFRDIYKEFFGLIFEKFIKH